MKFNMAAICHLGFVGENRGTTHRGTNRIARAWTRGRLYYTDECHQNYWQGPKMADIWKTAAVGHKLHYVRLFWLPRHSYITANVLCKRVPACIRHIV